MIRCIILFSTEIGKNIRVTLLTAASLVTNNNIILHGGESRDILHIYSDRTGKHIRHYFFNAE